MAGFKNFNYMFFLPFKGDFAEFAFHDAFALNNFRVMIPIFTNNNNKISLSFTPYIPSNNPTAFKNFSVPNSSQLFYADFHTRDPIVFLFFPHRFYLFEATGFFRYLRNNYPGCKLVLFMTDPVYHFQQNFNMFFNEANTKSILSTFDCVLSYNIVDAADYGLTYFEGPHSIFPYDHAEEDIDIFFVGHAGDRLERILRAYEAFKAAGFVCDFYIVKVDTPPRLPDSDDLHFNQFLPYPETLKHVRRSRAILDITRVRNYGLTVRYFESLAYNKIFITDNAFYRQDRFNSPKLFLIDKSFEIDKEQFMSASKLPSNYRNEYSPLHMITFLESVLNA